MSDPLRTQAASPSDRPGDAAKDARIERLLLAGLDEYFAGEYEQAINVWTRVVFLERGHRRARAYIERARGALAERHRESEELLHRGIAAFNDGETEAARDLITRAVEQGGPHDVALVLLERLNRLTVRPSGTDAPAAIKGERRAPAAPPEPPTMGSSRRLAAIASLILVASLAAVVLGVVPVDRWLAGDGAAPGVQATALSAEPLPLARPSDRVLARARVLQSGGHFLDALRALESVDAADPLRAEADRLRGVIQRQLLEAGPAEASR